MAKNLTISSFVAQAARLGENSDEALTLNLKTGTLGASKVGFSARRGALFRAGTFPAWNAFSQSLRASFGASALPPELERTIAQGKPLTARAVIQLTRRTQETARGSAIGGLSAILANGESTEKGFLLAHPNDELLDAYIALKADPLFAAAGPHPDTRQLMLAAFLRGKEERPDDFLGDSAPVGLSGLAGGATFTGAETSVEDLTRLPHDALEVGDPIGTISAGDDADSKRYIFAGLKNKGVEPGFLVRKNWLPSHEKALRGESDPDDPIHVMGLKQAERRVAAVIAGPDRNEARYMLAALGSTIPGEESRERFFRELMADGADHVRLLARFTEGDIRAFAGETLRNPNALFHEELAGDARLHVRANLREFTETHVIKLDYNESDRSAMTRSLRLPERIKESHGTFFQFFRRSTVREANRGAVAEALANDIARTMGVPAQTLKIVRGSYRDGTPKLLLDSTYISGTDGVPYRDFDHFIRDGYLDKDLLKAGGHPGAIRDLGKYKAAFLLMGDRDAVGSKGQNKGFVGNTFAAIDPGHSLEGNWVSVRDDFSFTASKSFKNFTVFDDSPLSEKMAGWDEIEQAVGNESIARLFTEYIKQFGDPGNGELNFLGDIEKMVKEFYGRYDAMRKTLAPRLAVYRGLPGDPPGTGPGLLDALENVEKLFSETSPVSPRGEVRLEHLRVEKRLAVDMTRDAAGVTLTCRDRRQAAAMAERLGRFLGEPARWTMQNGTLRIPAGQIEDFMAAFAEPNVRRFKAT